MSVITIDPVKKAEIDRAIAEKDIEIWFEELTNEGWLSPAGFRLGLTTSDITLLTGNYVLAKEADALNLPIPPVIDMRGVPHEVETIEELTALMLGYGQYRAQLSAEYAAKKAALP